MTPNDEAAVTIRPEEPGDRAAIHAVHTAAFGQRDEADILDLLRAAISAEEGATWVSLVACRAGAVVGHIVFTDVTLESGREGDRAVALGPMAVLPARQLSGIGSGLVEEGLRACRAAGHTLVVVIGHDTYYPRFGFVEASTLGLRCEYGVPSEVFMALPLVSEEAMIGSGTVRIRPEFDD